MGIGPDDHNSPMQKKTSCQTCKTIQIEMKRTRSWMKQLILLKFTVIQWTVF
jgi:hypothetical protein